MTPQEEQEHYLKPLPGRDLAKKMKMQLEKDLHQLYLYGTRGDNIPECWKR